MFIAELVKLRAAENIEKDDESMIDFLNDYENYPESLTVGEVACVLQVNKQTVRASVTHRLFLASCHLVTLL